MLAEKYVIVYLQSQQLLVVDGFFWKNGVSENKLLCSVFVTDSIKELSEVRQEFNSITVM